MAPGRGSLIKIPVQAKVPCSRGEKNTPLPSAFAVLQGKRQREGRKTGGGKASLWEKLSLMH